VPTARLLAEHLTRDAIQKRLGWNDLEFVFAELETQDPLERSADPADFAAERSADSERSEKDAGIAGFGSGERELSCREIAALKSGRDPSTATVLRIREAQFSLRMTRIEDMMTIELKSMAVRCRRCEGIPTGGHFREY